MKRVFDKAVVFGDIHFGNKNNSKIFNSDCDEYIDWLIEKSDKLKANTCIFLGDWFHNRRFINIHTLNSSLKNMQKLNDFFDHTIMIVGNHDLYYKERRDVTSLKVAENFKNIEIVYDIMEVGDCLFVPWLIADEWKKVTEYSKKYVFGHFELPRFLVNSYVEMPDKGELSETHLSKNEFVLSGHFHKRQIRGNIHYIGNCFPHTYSDVDDFDRGFVYIEWGKDLVYHNWENMPYYTKISLSKALKIGFENIVKNKAHIKLIIDIPLSYEESLYLKEKLLEDYKCREVQLVPVNIEAENEKWDNTEIKTVDEMVYEGLKSLENVESNLNIELLLDIYSNLNIDDEIKNL